jgi:hypothetical protein
MASPRAASGQAIRFFAGVGEVKTIQSGQRVVKPEYLSQHGAPDSIYQIVPWGVTTS